MVRYFAMLFILIQTCGFAGYHSQCGQDKFVNETFFKDMKNGVFLDVGAHDGVSLSNTLFFEKERSWSGICIEPMPEIFAQLQQNRSCQCVCGCASPDHNITKDFLRIFGPVEMLSGLVDTFDPQQIPRIEREISIQGGSYEIIPVQCYNLNKLLEEAGIYHVDFMSLDTEGGEYDILQNFDFTKCPVDVITVEDNYKIHDFKSLLESNGFVFVRNLEQDMVFIRKDSPIYKKTKSKKKPLR